MRYAALVLTALTAFAVMGNAPQLAVAPPPRPVHPDLKLSDGEFFAKHFPQEWKEYQKLAKAAETSAFDAAARVRDRMWEVMTLNAPKKRAELRGQAPVTVPPAAARDD